MILIVSFEGNEHVERVRAHLKGESVVIDQAWFPSTLRLDARLSNEAESLSLALPDGRHVILGEVGAVWNRRIRPFSLNPDLVDITSWQFAWSESTEAILGLWRSLNCFWMNPLSADDISQRKIRQLQVAREVGLRIPDTVVTNDPSVARDFIRVYGTGQVVRKAFRNIQEAPRETMVVTDEHLGLLDGVRYAPVIFQRFVPLSLDLRVTIVEDEVFAASIESDRKYEADYRSGLNSAKVEAYDLPDDVQSRLLELVKHFDLKFAAIDLRVTPEGEHVFFEVNPAGEYLFIADRTDLPIPQAIAACLDRHDAEHQRAIARS